MGDMTVFGFLAETSECSSERGRQSCPCESHGVLRSGTERRVLRRQRGMKRRVVRRVRKGVERRQKRRTREDTEGESRDLSVEVEEPNLLHAVVRLAMAQRTRLEAINS